MGRTAGYSALGVIFCDARLVALARRRQEQEMPGRRATWAYNDLLSATCKQGVAAADVFRLFSGVEADLAPYQRSPCD
jgi:hypothetical protein